jgi:membrane protein
VTPHARAGGTRDAFSSRVATDVVDKPPGTEVIGGRSRTEPNAPRTGGSFSNHVAVRFVKQLAREVRADGIADVGAMLTFYAILALFPMLVFVVTLALLVLDQHTVLEGVAMVTETMPESTRDLIAGRVEQFIAAATPGFAFGSAVLTLWGASRGAAALSGALNTMFDKRETRSWVRRQLLAIGVTLAMALLMVIALGLLVVGPLVGNWIADRAGLGGFGVLWGIVRWVGAGLLVMTVWALLYKWLPNTSAPFRIFTPGAVVGVLLWLGISKLFGLYLKYFDRYEATYGVLGSAIIFLTWLWLSNIALLLGAEINGVLADFRKHKSPAAAQLADPDEATPSSTA